MLSVFFNNTEILYLGLGYLVDEDFVKLIFIILCGMYLVYLLSCQFYSRRELLLLMVISFVSIISGFRSGYLDYIAVVLQLLIVVAYINKFILLNCSARVRVVLLTSFWSQFVILVINILDFVFRASVLDISYQNVFPIYFALMLFSSDMVAFANKSNKNTFILYSLGIRLDHLNTLMTLILMAAYLGFYTYFPNFRVEMKIFGLVFIIIILKYLIRLSAIKISMLGVWLVAGFFIFGLSLNDQDLSIYSGLIGFERENSLLLRIAVLNEQAALLKNGDDWLSFVFGISPGFSALRYDFYHPVFKEHLVNLPSHAGLFSIVSDIGVLGLLVYIFTLMRYLSGRASEIRRNSAILFFIFLLMNIVSIQWIPSAIYYHFGGAVLLIQILSLSSNES